MLTSNLDVYGTVSEDRFKMYKTSTCTLVLMALVFQSVTVNGFEQSAIEKDFLVQSSGNSNCTEEITNTPQDPQHQHCYKYNCTNGVPKLCWTSKLDYDNNNTTLQMNIECVAAGSRKYTIKLRVDEEVLNICPPKSGVTNAECSYVSKEPAFYAGRQFRCHFYKGNAGILDTSNNTPYTLNTFTLRDDGKPSKPVLRQEGNSLKCYANNTRSSSALEIIELESPNNNISIIVQNDTFVGINQFEISYDLPHSTNGTFVCKHNYATSGKSEYSERIHPEVNYTIPSNENGLSNDKMLRCVIYGVTGLVIFGVLLCVIIACCRCCKYRKREFYPTESSIQDIFTTPTPKEQSNEVQYAVPVPKSQRKAADVYAMVIPKTKRPEYADPAYADPCDLRVVEPDPLYMEIGTALYASINIYDEVPQQSGRFDSEGVQYANSVTMNRNIMPSPSPMSKPKPATAPRPMPRQRLK